LTDAVARVSTIALVHDSLSRSPGEDVAFDEISRRVLAMARDVAAAADSPARVQVTGSFGVLPSAVATPLAMVFAEILLNAMEHSHAQEVRVQADRTSDALTLKIADDGVGFDPQQDEGLGLQIVRTLVAEQLHGNIVISSAPRTAGESHDAEEQQEMVTEVTISCQL